MSSGDATERWRRDVRPRTIQAVVAATQSLKWSPDLIEVLAEELYVDDQLEALLANAPRRLQSGRYPQAIALALILRHSWRADDLTYILKRLRLEMRVPSAP